GAVATSGGGGRRLAWMASWTATVSSSGSTPRPSSQARLRGRGAAHARAPPAAAPGVDPHQLAVARLVQGVEGQPAAGGVDRVVPVVLADLGRGQPLQGPGELPSQSLGLEVLPVVEAGAAAQAEPGQEVA